MDMDGCIPTPDDYLCTVKAFTVNWTSKSFHPEVNLLDLENQIASSERHIRVAREAHLHARAPLGPERDLSNTIDTDGAPHAFGHV